MKGWLWSVYFFVSVVVVCSGMSSDELEDFSNFLRKTSVLDQNLKDGYDSSQESDEDEDSPSDHAWETSGKFEGDLILNDRQRRLIVEDVAIGLSRNGLKDSTKRWPDNEVIYYIQKEHFSGDQVQAIQDGIDDLARASCVKFRPYRKGDRDAVVIQGSRRGCFSQVGYQGGYQVLNLSGRHPVGRGCFRHGTVVHELLHTLGFYHMQSSPDRDDYIDVVWDNVLQPAKHNFRKYNSFSVSDFGVGYDYDSVLHYSRKAFSNNGGDTLVPKQADAEIGQRVGLSEKDTQKLNKMYCDADSDSFHKDHVSTGNKVTKKKKGNNQPFQGEGLGYHQGKAVVIKLPATETFQLSDSPSIQPFDYFSKAPKALQPTLAEGFNTKQEVTHSKRKDISKSIDVDKTNENDSERKMKMYNFDDYVKPYEPPDTHYSAEFAPNYPQTIEDAFKRLDDLEKRNGFYTPDFIKDKEYYASPVRETKSKSINLNGHFDEPSPKFKFYESKHREVEPTYSKESEAEDKIQFDSSYGTKLPNKNIIIADAYSNLGKNDSEINLKRLENLHDYEPLYNRRSNNTSDGTDYKIFGSPVPLVDPWYKNRQTDHLTSTEKLLTESDNTDYKHQEYKIKGSNYHDHDVEDKSDDSSVEGPYYNKHSKENYEYSDYYPNDYKHHTVPKIHSPYTYRVKLKKTVDYNESSDEESEDSSSIDNKAIAEIGTNIRITGPFLIKVNPKVILKL